MQDHSKQFWATPRKSTHLNGDPFRLVPGSNSTIQHMAKPNLSKQARIIKIAGLHRYQQFIMVKMGIYEEV